MANTATTACLVSGDLATLTIQIHIEAPPLPAGPPKLEFAEEVTVEDVKLQTVKTCSAVLSSMVSSWSITAYWSHQGTSASCVMLMPTPRMVTPS